MLVNPDVVLGHMTIGEPLFEFAAAARTTDLLNFPHRFRRAIDILDDYEVEIAFEFAKPVYPRPTEITPYYIRHCPTVIDRR